MINKRKGIMVGKAEENLDKRVKGKTRSEGDMIKWESRKGKERHEEKDWR